MHSILHILNTSTELMSAVELMSGAKSRKWVHQKPTNQPTNQPSQRRKIRQIFEDFYRKIIVNWSVYYYMSLFP